MIYYCNIIIWMERENSKVLIQFLLIFRQSGDVLFFLYARRLRGYTATAFLLHNYLLNEIFHKVSPLGTVFQMRNIVAEMRDLHLAQPISDELAIKLTDFLPEHCSNFHLEYLNFFWWTNLRIFLDGKISPSTVSWNQWSRLRFFQSQKRNLDRISNKDTFRPNWSNIQGKKISCFNLISCLDFVTNRYQHIGLYIWRALLHSGKFSVNSRNSREIINKKLTLGAWFPYFVVAKSEVVLAMFTE